MKLRRFLIIPLLIILPISCCHNSNLPKLNYNLPLSFTRFTNYLNTGDIILFHGDSDFDKVTDYLECSPWAHVGMIVKSKDNQTYLWESTLRSNVKDVDYHKTKGGPQLVRLKDRLVNDVEVKDHSGWAIRRLLVSDTVRNSFDDVLNHIIQIEHEKDIPNAIDVFLEAALGRFMKVETNEKKIFCSELMVLTYMHMALVSNKTIANSYVPKDFSSDSDKLRFLQKKTALSKEHYFKPVTVNGVLHIRTTSNLDIL